jgi:hypothetical protein
VHWLEKAKIREKFNYAVRKEKNLSVHYSCYRTPAGRKPTVTAKKFWSMWRRQLAGQLTFWTM